MDLKDLLAIVWKRRVLALLTALAAVIVAAAVAFARTDRYQSTATLAMTPNVQKGQGFVASDDLSTLLSTYSSIVTSSSIRGSAAALLGHPLGATISADTTAGTGILRISATSTDPDTSQRAADAVSRAFQQKISGTSQLVVVQTVGPPTVPSSPVSPRRPLIIGVGVILGLALGVGIALVTDRWFDRVATAADVTLAGASCLARIPRSKLVAEGGSNSLIWEHPELFGFQEAIRSLRTTLQMSADDGHILQVTSPMPGDGKSTISANLAVAIASVGIPTTLVDADFWRPRQHVIFGVSNATGLSNMLSSDGRRQLSARRTRFKHLSIITSGPLPVNPTEMLAAGIDSLIERLRRPGRIVILDTPPVLALSDARLVGGQADSVIVVASAGRTKAAMLRLTLEQLQGTQSHVAGVVLNGVKETPAEQAGYGTYYRAREQAVALVADESTAPRR